MELDILRAELERLFGLDELTATTRELLDRLDEQDTRTPFYGVRRMRAWLRSEGYAVNPKRVRRLLRLPGLEAIYPKPRLSLAGEGHRIYPYLLRGVKVERRDQVWSTDITTGSRSMRRPST